VKPDATGVQASFHAMVEWRVLEKVATGGMADIYRAEQACQAGFRRVVGLKVMREDKASRPGYREMFLREARLAGGLCHDHLQQVLGLVSWGDKPAIVLEWVDGINAEELNTRLDQHDRYMPPGLALYVITCLARGLDAAHRRRDRHGQAAGLLHRDISPVNVLIGWDGRVKLADFGIATCVTDGDHVGPEEVLGKSPYLSPEQARDEPLDPRSDIFSLGLVFFELLTGEQLFPAQNLAEVLDLHRRWDLRSPRAWNPAIAPDIDALFAVMTARDPDARPASAREVVDAGRAILGRAGDPIDAVRLQRWLAEQFTPLERQAPHGGAFTVPPSAIDALPVRAVPRPPG
jgi:serine/threonine protein kinase